MVGANGRRSLRMSIELSGVEWGLQLNIGLHCRLCTRGLNERCKKKKVAKARRLVHFRGPDSFGDVR